jgi:hypothetical protein
MRGFSRRRSPLGEIRPLWERISPVAAAMLAEVVSSSHSLPLIAEAGDDSGSIRKSLLFAETTDPREKEMEQRTDDSSIERLAALVGDWRMAAEFEGAPPAESSARVGFEWMPGRRYLIERWEISGLDPLEMPAAGIAIIGADPEIEGNFLQHYFDSRGVARIYKMSLRDGVWKLWRDSPDHSPLDFSQRYTGTFSDDGKSISGSWEICHDGTTWEHDFDLTYTKAS